MTIANRIPPTAEDYIGYKQRLSNWGRWGADDQLGTLNHITPDVKTAAAALVRAGRSVSCASSAKKLANSLRVETRCGGAGRTRRVGAGKYRVLLTGHVRQRPR